MSYIAFSALRNKELYIILKLIINCCKGACTRIGNKSSAEFIFDYYTLLYMMANECTSYLLSYLVCFF